MLKFVREAIVHYGFLIDTEDGPRVYFLCERKRLLGALYGGDGRERPPLYTPGLETFRIYDDVDCMTCLVAEARRK